MTAWTVAAAYVLAAATLLAGLGTGRDPRLRHRLLLASSRRRLLVRLGARVHGAARERLSGIAQGVNPEELDRALGMGVVLSGGGLLLGATAAADNPGLAVVVGGVLAAAGWRGPGILLARREAARLARCSAQAPDLLDTVAVSVSAGLSPRLALDRLPEVIAPPLGALVRAARADVSLGVPWRQVLVQGAAAEVPELRRLASVLDRAERLGSPVAERLRDLARDVRAERRSVREERARRAPVQMLFPLVFLVLPAFLLAAVVPAVLVATRDLP